MSRGDDRFTRKLQNAERQDVIEQKLGISQAMNKLRDERALYATERFEREALREKQRQDRERLRNRDRTR